MRAFLIIFLSTTLLLRADEPIPEKLKSQDGLFQDYLSDFLRSGMIKDVNETRLLAKLSESEQHNLPLLCYLGYIGKIHFQAFGSIQEPGQSPKPSFTDAGYMNIQFSRMKLASFFEDRQQGARIYVFTVASMMWPGLNNTCVLLTTPDDDPLDWRGHEQSDMLESCNYNPAAQELSLVCKRRSGGETTYTYKVRHPHVELSQ